MRSLLLLLVACGSSSPPPAPQQTVIKHSTASCADAALGLENATRGVREPEHRVFDALRARCNSDLWPAIAVTCFATMSEGDLGRCARDLPDGAREAMFAVLAGGESDRAGIVVAKARLEQLEVGVPACDRFVAAVATVLSCEEMPLDVRVQLGRETADFWSLPTSRLSSADMHRMANVCGESLAALEQQVIGLGCMP